MRWSLVVQFAVIIETDNRLGNVSKRTKEVRRTCQIIWLATNIDITLYRSASPGTVTDEPFCGFARCNDDRCRHKSDHPRSGRSKSEHVGPSSKMGMHIALNGPCCGDRQPPALSPMRCRAIRSINDHSRQAASCTIWREEGSTAVPSRPELCRRPPECVAGGWGPIGTPLRSH